MHFRIWLFCLLLLCLCVAAADDDDATCSSTKRCKNGCCNKSGNCGFGPDYCGTNCRSDCGRKAECNPGTFDSKWATREKCPLNVCCSEHGYCGTTKAYCGSKKVKRPSCSKDNGISRVVGYFEGWAASRPCEAFWPEQIPIGLYTHIIFAFATIDPKTFTVKEDKRADIKIYKRLRALKAKDPKLKIYVALGGWTFNDPGLTNRTFSDLAASVPRQKKFMDSLMSFMSTHDFDGLDLDWEYPEAEDRAGRTIDYANFPKFMSRLKDMMDEGNKGLTITLPASYWYLKHFDIKALEKTVDFFNIMSYDLHGAWDQKANWTAPYLNAHTNLTEIELALDLLWRNNIDYDKVVMGLGFYGRAFTAQAANCMKPGCLFKDPGNEGDCSREKGILLNSEIDAIIKKRNLKPEFDKEAAVKIAKWGKQWVAYEDEETLKLKTEYAQSRCLGGVMVWAISHDTKDAKYNKALAKTLGRRVTSGSLDDDEQASEIIKIPNEQCRWTNCKEGCPKGWVNVARSDKSARKGEKMFDETGCGGDGAHSFCCPGTEKLPTCGWYGFNGGGGKCAKGDSCPSNMVEIASNQMYCKTPQGYQSACCTTDVTSMKVYGTCEWGMYPNCDLQEGCPNKLGDRSKDYMIAGSASGSGGGRCDEKKNPLGLNVPGTQFRKLCCNANNPNLRFTDCQWFHDVGPAPDPRPRDFCRSGCPPDRVRVAIDTEADECSLAGIGGKARCCKTSFNDEFEVENSKLDAYRSVMKEWVDNPTCPNPSSVFSRRAVPFDDTVANASLSMELDSRDIKVDKITPLFLLIRIYTLLGSEEMREEERRIWDNSVEEDYPYLTTNHTDALKEASPEWELQGPEEMARRVLCSPHSYNARVAAIQGMNGNGRARWINCTYAICDKDGVCLDEQGEPERRRAMLPTRSTHLSHHWLHARQISKPDESSVIMVDAEGEDLEIEYEVPAHDPPNKLREDHPALKATGEFAEPGECSEWLLADGLSWDPERGPYNTEHPIDKSIMKRFFLDVATGRLRTGAKSLYGPIPLEFFSEVLRLGHDAQWPPIKGNPNFTNGNLLSRLMECLGSQTNDLNFAVTDKTLNQVKGQLMNLAEPIGEKAREKKIPNDIDYVLAVLRASVSTFAYMQSDYKKSPDIFHKVENVVNDILLQLQYAEVLWDRAHPGRPVRISQFFKEWLQDYYTRVTAKAQGFLQTTMDEVRDYWGERTDADARQVMEKIRALEHEISRLRIYTNWRTPLLKNDEDSDTDTDMSG